MLVLNMIILIRRKLGNIDLSQDIGMLAERDAKGKKLLIMLCEFPTH
jgi:hypothetical protein